MKYRYFLCLGSNIDREANMPAAVRLLGALGRVEAVSQVYETEPVGLEPGAAAFFNAAAALRTDLEPAAVKDALRREVEEKLGRPPSPEGKWISRTIDVDVALGFDASGNPVVPPDPDLTAFLHVARPVADLAPDLVPDGESRTLAEIARHLEGAHPLPVVRPDVILEI